MTEREPAKVLTIAGSDSGGAAGIQADLRLWALLGVYGMSAITAVTAQNSVEVSAIQFMSPNFVTAQIEAVLTDYGALAAKTGLIGDAAVIGAVADRLRHHQLRSLVVDPVLVDHRREPLFSNAVVEAYRRYLLPLALVVTPNWYEAALLAGLPAEKLRSWHDLEPAARLLHDLGAAHVVITGYPTGREIVDYYFDGRSGLAHRAVRVPTANTHGSGDTFSAAACAFLAQGDGVGMAVERAHHLATRAVARGASWRLGQGHGPVLPW